MRIIHLTKRAVTVVDEETYQWASPHNWHLTSAGYAARRAVRNGKDGIILLHREIMATPKGLVVDHINRDTLDNRIENLRNVSHSTNHFNAGNRKNNTSGHKGVSWSNKNGKWFAQIMVNYKARFLGYYANLEDAIEARKNAEAEL